MFVEFEEKTIQHWFTYFQIVSKYLNYFMTQPLILFLTISVSDN